jgi:hypothetical protein
MGSRIFHVTVTALVITGLSVTMTSMIVCPTLALMELNALIWEPMTISVTVQAWVLLVRLVVMIWMIVIQIPVRMEDCAQIWEL